MLVQDGSYCLVCGFWSLNYIKSVASFWCRWKKALEWMTEPSNVVWVWMKSCVVDYSNETSSIVFSQGAFYLVWNSNFESACKVVSHHGTIYFD